MNSYIAAVRKCGRVLGLFLSLLLILGTAGSHQAQANGVVASIGNGQVVYGSVSGTNYDTYSFPVAAGSWIIWNITATSAYDARFASEADLYRPGGGLAAYAYGYYFAGDVISTGANPAGTYTIYVSNYFGSSYPALSGGYALQVFVLPGQPAQSGGFGGGQMNIGSTYSGSINLGSSDVYNFNGVSGNNYSLTLTKVSGSTYFDPWMIWSDPTGASILSTYATSTTTSTHAAATGPYTVVVSQLYDGGNYSGDYTLEVSGTGTSQPVAGKQDGGRCIPCEEAAKARAAGGGTPPQSGDITSTGGTNAGTDPINIATGNVYEKVTDYTTVGTNPLALVRSYNSMSYTRNEFPTLMGANWRTNFDRYIRVVSASQATAERPDGQVINFALSGGTGTPDSDVDVKLTYSGSTYTLTDSDDVVETYAVTSGKGVVSSIAWPNGYTQTFNYTSGVLTSVSDSYSRSLSFTYTSGVLTGVSTPDSATLTYGYTTTAGQSLLTSVTYNTSPSTNQTYVYGNTSYPFMLTGITDENSNSFASYTYDGQGRCTMSEHAGGADEMQVAYNTNGTVAVTGPLGNVETYSFTTVNNMSKVSQIVRTVNSPVAAATRTFTYDGNGYLATATDWDGNSTHWTNNSHGQPTSITEAYGVGVARTTTISYDSTRVHKPYTITKTNVTIDDRYDATQGTLLTHKLTDTTGGSTNGQTHLDLYLQRNRRDADRADAAHRHGGQEHVYVYGRRADQHYRPAFARDHDQHLPRWRAADENPRR